MGNGKILIAENNRHDLETLTRILVTAGYEVLQAVDGAETVSTARCHQPDLILLNTSFPPDVSHGGGAFTDGFLIIQWLKRMEEAAGIRVILMTDDNAEGLQARARAVGAVGLFQKPVNQDALLVPLRGSWARWHPSRNPKAPPKADNLIYKLASGSLVNSSPPTVRPVPQIDETELTRDIRKPGFAYSRYYEISFCKTETGIATAQ